MRFSVAFHTKTYEAYGNIRVKPNQPCNYLDRGHKSKVNIFGQYLNTKFQAFCHLLSLCSLICVGPGREPRRPVFSQRGSIIVLQPCQTSNRNQNHDETRRYVSRYQIVTFSKCKHRVWLLVDGVYLQSVFGA